MFTGERRARVGVWLLQMPYPNSTPLFAGSESGGSRGRSGDEQQQKAKQNRRSVHELKVGFEHAANAPSSQPSHGGASSEGKPGSPALASRQPHRQSLPPSAAFQMRAAALNAILESRIKSEEQPGRARGSSEPPPVGQLEEAGREKQPKPHPRMAPPPPDVSESEAAMRRMYFGGFKEGFVPPEPVEPAPIPPEGSELPPTKHPERVEGRRRSKEKGQAPHPHLHQIEVDDGGFMPVGAFLTNSSSDASASSFAGGGRMKTVYNDQHQAGVVQTRNSVDDDDFAPPPEPPPDYDMDMVRPRPDAKSQRPSQPSLPSVATLDAADLAISAPTDVVLRRVAPPPPTLDAREQKVSVLVLYTYTYTYSLSLLLVIGF